MSRLTKFSLAMLSVNAIASVLILTGVVNVSAVPGLYVVFPLAEVSGGMFLIFHVLEKEAAAFDAEHHVHHDPAVPDQHSEPGEPISGHEHHEPVHA